MLNIFEIDENCAPSATSIVIHVFILFIVTHPNTHAMK